MDEALDQEDVEAAICTWQAYVENRAQIDEVAACACARVPMHAQHIHMRTAHTCHQPGAGWGRCLRRTAVPGRKGANARESGALSARTCGCAHAYTGI